MDLFRILIFADILIVSGIASFQDIKKQKVQNVVIFLGILTVVITYLVLNFANLRLAVLSGFIYFLFYLIVKIVTKGKLGNADLFFGIIQGLSLPIELLPICVLLESLFAFSTVSIFKNRNCTKKSIPFIPFMAVSLILLYFCTEVLM